MDGVGGGAPTPQTGARIGQLYPLHFYRNATGESIRAATGPELRRLKQVADARSGTPADMAAVLLDRNLPNAKQVGDAQKKKIPYT